jgi:predicted nucleic acid-binding protein
VTPVLDASLFVAAISPAERRHAEARALFESHPDTDPFLVPDLFRVEVIAALSRRGEPVELIDVIDAVVRSPRFHPCKLDAVLLEEATRVAREARLRAYDAVYVALALLREQPLFTLDGEVRQRCGAAFPGLRVQGPI